jgi:acetyl-CoA acetyltransferase
MSRDIFVVGVSMTKFGRLPDQSLKQLSQQAVADALADAGVCRGDISGIYFGNAMQGHMEGQHCIRGQVVLRENGFERVPIINVENACASGSTAFAEAVKFLKAGEGDLSLALGVEKLYSADRARMFSAFDSAWDVSTVEENIERLAKLGAGIEPSAEAVSGKPYSRFLDVYAAFGRFNIREYGLTQRQLAAIASKNHMHSVHNERAQFRQAYTIDEIMAAPSIVYPLTLPMCSPISDGAAAAILCTEEGLKRFGVAPHRAIRVLASVIGTGTTRLPEEYGTKHIVRLTAERTYERAGLGPDSIDVAEVHDATAIGEAIATEGLGFAAPGEGGAIAESGVTSLGGRLPVNPSGGLESKGHPLGATGLGQIFELVSQLRGECGRRQVEGARIGLAENGGGLWGYEEATCVLTILERNDHRQRRHNTRKG